MRRGKASSGKRIQSKCADRSDARSVEAAHKAVKEIKNVKDLWQARTSRMGLQQ
jgi:hypothetical protein